MALGQISFFCAITFKIMILQLQIQKDRTYTAFLVFLFVGATMLYNYFISHTKHVIYFLYYHNNTYPDKPLKESRV